MNFWWTVSAVYNLALEHSAVSLPIPHRHPTAVKCTDSLDCKTECFLSPCLLLSVVKSTVFKFKYHFFHEAIPTTQVQPAVQMLCPLNSTKPPVFKKYHMPLSQTPPSYKCIVSSFHGLAYCGSPIHNFSLSFLGPPPKVQIFLWHLQSKHVINGELVRTEGTEYKVLLYIHRILFHYVSLPSYPHQALSWS